MKKTVLFFLASCMSITIAHATPLSTDLNHDQLLNELFNSREPEYTHQLGPWQLACEKRSYPGSKGEARYHTNGRQVHAEICDAKQTVALYYRDKHVIATSKISPFDVMFVLQNIIIDKDNAKILLNDHQSISLMTDCHDLYGDQSCVLVPKDPNDQFKLKTAIRSYHDITMQIMDDETKEPINIVFSCLQGNELINAMDYDAQSIKNAFRNVFGLPIA